MIAQSDGVLTMFVHAVAQGVADRSLTSAATKERSRRHTARRKESSRRCAALANV